MKRMIRTAALGLGLLAVTATAQDMMRQWSPSSGPTFENLSNLRLMDFAENQRSTALA